MILSLYLIVASYLLARLEDGRHSAPSIIICLLWLPAGLIYLSAVLADAALGDHSSER